MRDIHSLTLFEEFSERFERVFNRHHLDFADGRLRQRSTAFAAARREAPF
jgi:hypothetical protein